jgi:ketosteroid isomerase-like protein
MGAGEGYWATMSQENVETLRRLYGFFEDRDYSLIEHAVHPDAVIDVSRNIFNPGIHRGVEGLRRFLKETDQMWIDFDVTPEEFIDAGDNVIVAHRLSGTGRESGVPVEMLLFVVVEFLDGKIIRFTGGLRSREDALRFAGIPN